MNRLRQLLAKVLIRLGYKLSNETLYTIGITTGGTEVTYTNCRLTKVRHGLAEDDIFAYEE